MGGHQLQGSVPYSITSGTGGHQLQGSVPYSSTSVAQEDTSFKAQCHTASPMAREDTSFKAQCHTASPVAQEDTSSDTTSGHIHHHSRLAEKAKESPLGNHFRTTVRPKDLPECWGIKYTCDIDLDSMHQERVVESWNPVDFCREEDMLPCREEDMLPAKP